MITESMRKEPSLGVDCAAEMIIAFSCNFLSDFENLKQVFPAAELFTHDNTSHRFLFSLYHVKQTRKNIMSLRNTKIPRMVSTNIKHKLVKLSLC